MKPAQAAWLETAVAAAGAGATVVRDSLGGPQRVDRKAAVDLVTEVDLASEEAIRTVLGQRTPGSPILAEEQGGPVDAATRWIVDPLDGTTNFVHGFPAFAVSVGLQVDGRLEAGCIVDPLRGEVYDAVRGGGARLDGRPLRVSGVGKLSEALLLTGFPYDRRERAGTYLAFVQAFLERAQGVRRAGAAALDLCHIAAGRADGFWEFGLSAWDVAAGVLLVEEAGGRVSDMTGAPLDVQHPRLLATNGLVHDAMIDVLASLLPCEDAMT